MDHTRSTARAGNCQFYRYRTYKDRRPDKAVVADKIYGVYEAIETGYVTSGTMRRRLPEGSYLRGCAEMENHA